MAAVAAHLCFRSERFELCLDLQVTLTKFGVNWPFGSGEDADY